MPSDSQQRGYCMKIRKQFGQDWRNWSQRALLTGMEGGAAALENRTVLLKKIKMDWPCAPTTPPLWVATHDQ